MMKIFFSKKVKWISGVFIIALILTIVILNVTGYIFNCKYISVIAAVEEINKYEIRNNLLLEAMDNVGVCNGDDAVKIWATGLENRNAAQQYSVLSKKLKKEYAKQLEESAPNWVTGVSSPWVESYKIVKKEKPNDKTGVYYLSFSTATSDGPAGDYSAVITVSKEDKFCLIIKISTDEGLYMYTGFNPPKS